MNIRLYFKIVFYFLGTCLVLFVLIVLGVNFFKDARPFGKPSVKPVLSVDSVAVTEKKSMEKGGETHKPEEAEVQVTSVPVDETTQADRINVEVINYSGIPGLAEKIRGKLEAAGYSASSGNGRSSGPVRSELVERNDKKAAGEIKKLLGPVRVRKEYISGSRYDVTLIIGDDYKETGN